MCLETGKSAARDHLARGCSDRQLRTGAPDLLEAILISLGRESH